MATETLHSCPSHCRSYASGYNTSSRCHKTCGNCSKNCGSSTFQRTSRKCACPRGLRNLVRSLASSYMKPTSLSKTSRRQQRLRPPLPSTKRTNHSFQDTEVISFQLGQRFGNSRDRGFIARSSNKALQALEN